MSFRCVSEDIYKLDIPCGDGYTSVFAFHNGGKWILADAGMSADDVDRCILPAAKERDIAPEWLVCSHLHDDHYGGFARLSELFPTAKAASFGNEGIPGLRTKYRLTDGEQLLDRYTVLSLGGHTAESIGIFDNRKRVLVAFDSLQLFGIGAYGTNIQSPGEYAKTLDRVSALQADGIIASHDYVPCGAEAFGREAADTFIDECRRAVKLITDTIFTVVDTAELSSAQPKEAATQAAERVAAVYNAENKHLPLISSWTVQNFLTDLLKLK